MTRGKHQGSAASALLLSRVTAEEALLHGDFGSLTDTPFLQMREEVCMVASPSAG